MDQNGLFAFLADVSISKCNCGKADCWIIYVDSSALTIISGQESHTVPSGYIAIVNADGNSLKFCAEPGFSGHALQISDIALTELVQRYLLLMNAKNANVHICATGKQKQGICTVLQNLVAEMHADMDTGETILNLLLQELLVRILRASPKVHSGRYSNISKVVSNVCMQLEKEYSRSIKLETIAASYNISVSYLSHIFKEITGVSLMRYLLLVRIRVAQEYLTQTSLPVNEIAEKSGFNDVSNFGRTFKKEAGCSPSRYRRLHTGQGDSNE